jgi:hypothetical protein
MERSAGVCQPDAGSSSRDASNLWGTFRAKKEAGRRVDLPIPGFSRREVRISAAPKLRPIARVAHRRDSSHALGADPAMSDPVLELDSGSEIVLLARFGALLGSVNSAAEDCAFPALMRALSAPGNLTKLRSNWSAVCSESIEIKQLSDDDLIEKIVADVAIGRVKAVSRQNETFGFTSKAKTQPAEPPRELPRERVTPSMRAIPKLPEPGLPKPPKLPAVPKVALPDLPTPPGALPDMPKLPEVPDIPDVPDVAALKDMAKAGAEKAAKMDELAKERALAEELLEKADKAREIANKVIKLRNASKEEIAAFAMQLAAEYGEDIPPEYRQMLREHGTAENIKKAEDKAENAADTASDVADKL